MDLEVSDCVAVPAFIDGPVTVYCGDVLDTLYELPDESVQCVVTSPPYWGLRDYGIDGQFGLEPTPKLYVERMTTVFREVRRVLRCDGTCWLNMGDGYAVNGGARGYGSADGSVGRGDAPGGQRRAPAGLKPKDLIGMPWRLAFALQADGWWIRSDIIWAKPNPMPESVVDRPTSAHEHIFLLTKSSRYYYDADAVREPDRQDHSRSVLDGQPSLAVPGQTPHRGIRTVNGRNGKGRNMRNVWKVTTKPYPGAHFATFPPAIPMRAIRAGTREGDTVLDPFAGSGTTLAVARRLNRRSIGIELNPSYIDLIRRRVDAVSVEAIRLDLAGKRSFLVCGLQA